MGFSCWIYDIPRSRCFPWEGVLCDSIQFTQNSYLYMFVWKELSSFKKPFIRCSFDGWKTKIMQKKNTSWGIFSPPRNINKHVSFSIFHHFFQGKTSTLGISPVSRSPGTSSVGSGPDFQVPGHNQLRGGWSRSPATQGFPNTSRVGGWKTYVTYRGSHLQDV